MNVKKMSLLAAIAVLTLTSGCATQMASLSKALAPASQPYLQVGVGSAVMLAVSKGVPIADIQGVANNALVIAKGINVSAATIQADLNALIAKSKLTPPQLIAANELSASLAVIINQYLSKNATSGNIVATTQLAVTDIADAVLVATGGVVPQ